MAEKRNIFLVGPMGLAKARLVVTSLTNYTLNLLILIKKSNVVRAQILPGYSILKVKKALDFVKNLLLAI